jgi:hypothetical protein
MANIENTNFLKSVILSLICPVSGKLLFEPVINSQDGIIYEACELEKKLVEDEDTNFNHVIIIPLKSFIDDLVEKIPALKQIRYVQNYDANKPSHNLNKIKVNGFIQNKRYDELLNYTHYSLNIISSQLEMIVKEAPHVFMHIISNSVDLEKPLIINNYKWRIIHCICRWGGSVDFLKYLLESKKININIQTENDKWTPMHMAVFSYHYTRKLDTIIYLIEQNANLFLHDSTNNTALDLICRYGDTELLNYVVDHLIDKYITNKESNANTISNMSNLIDMKHITNQLQLNQRLKPVKIIEYSLKITSIFEL